MEGVVSVTKKFGDSVEFLRSFVIDSLAMTYSDATTILNSITMPYHDRLIRSHKRNETHNDERIE